MFPINTPSATPDKKFTEGSPAGGVPATTVSAIWLNTIQTEILNVLADRGIEPSETDQAQLLQAINALIADEIPGFTPVEEGGGPGQEPHKINIGFGAAARLLLAVDGTNLGAFVLDSDLAAFLPKRVFTANDYLRIPDVPGGLIIQWGTVANSGTLTASNYIVPFPSGAAQVFISPKGAITFPASAYARPLSNSQFQYASNNVDASGLGWLAIGN